MFETQFEMMFFAAMSAIGIYSTAYYLYCQIWDLTAKVIKNRSIKKIANKEAP